MNRFLHTLSLLVMLLAAVPAYSQNFVFDWQSEPIDGHRTGVTASNADNVPSTMGVMKGRNMFLHPERYSAGESLRPWLP